jgi:hypothetical protein
MVVTEFNVERIAIDESKTDPPLIVDGDRMLTLAVTLQSVKAIPGRDP